MPKVLSCRERMHSEILSNPVLNFVWIENVGFCLSKQKQEGNVQTVHKQKLEGGQHFAPPPLRVFSSSFVLIVPNVNCKIVFEN